MGSSGLKGSALLVGASLLITLVASVPLASAAPSLTCTPSNPGPAGVLDVDVSGTSSASDLLTITASGGDYSLALTSGGSTSAVCTTFPDDSGSGYPTVTVTGSTELSTDFEVADPGLDLSGQPSASNTLDLSLLGTSFPAEFLVANGQALWGPNEDSFSGITTFVGPPAGGSAFIAPSGGGYTFDGLGTQNFLAVEAAGPGTTISVPDQTVTLGGAGSDAFSGISFFVGSNAGGTTFVAGDPGTTFVGSGSGNAVDFSHVGTSGPSPLIVNVSGSGVPSQYGFLQSPSADSAAGSYSFFGISSFTGAASGETTFLGDGAGGYSFTGKGPGNLLDLSVAGPGVSASLASGTVSGLTSSIDTISGIQTIDGPSVGGATFTGGSADGYTFNGAGDDNTFVAGSGSGTFTGGLGNGNQLDFSPVGTTQATPLEVNASSSFEAGLGGDTAKVGATTYSFSGFTTFNGSSSGNTTFFASGATGGYSFGFGGSGNTLDLSSLPGSGSSVSVGGGTVDWSGKEDSFSGVADFQGSSAGNTTFEANGTPGYGFDGTGPGNVLDLSAAGPEVTASAPDGAVTLGGSGSDHFQGISHFIGSTSGGTTVVAGSVGLGFDGQGTGNVLDLSHAAGPSALWINASGAAASSPYGGLADGTAANSLATYDFSDVSSFVGSTGGHTRFLADGAGGLTFTGSAAGNTLDLSAAGPGVSVSFASGTVSGLTSSDDGFSGIQTVDGPSAGGAELIGGSTNGYTFDAAGNGNSFVPGSGNGTFSGGAGMGNQLDFSQLLSSQATPLTVNAGAVPFGPVAGDTATMGPAVWGFSGISTFVGPDTGNTTFAVGATGGYAFEASGFVNTLDLSAAPGATVTVNGNSPGDPGTVTGLASGTDTFFDIQSFADAPTILYRLSVATQGDGAGTVTSAPDGIDCGSTCTSNFASGTQITLTATPAAGSVFEGWGGACSGTGTCQVTASSTQSVTASFSLLPVVTLSVTASGNGTGTVTSSPSGIDCGATCSFGFTAGTQVTLTASAAAGSTFEGWTGACTGTGVCSFAVNADATVDASFARDCVVPDVKGKSLKSAEGAIRANQCAVGKIGHAFSSTVKSGRVVSEKPAAGKTLGPGAAVGLTVSKGKRPRRK